MQEKIDLSKLSRDYVKQPLEIKKQGFVTFIEALNRNDLYYLYITCNLTLKEVAAFFGISTFPISKYLKAYNIKKEHNQLKNKQKQRFRKTMQSKYGVDAPLQNTNIRKRFTKTMLKRYEVEHALQNKNFMNKNIESNKLHHSGELSSKTQVQKEKYKQTCLKKYKVENTFQVKEFKEKTIQTNLKKYGDKYYACTDEFKSFMKNKYETENLVEKITNTKHKNGTIITSKPEEKIYKLLLEKFDEVLRQYKSKEYPFYCDFYIPNLKLYIEYQGHWNHGSHPFDKNNLKDLERLEILKDKSLIKKAYITAVDVWSIRDVKKREIAKKNKLNWIEFFNMKEFMRWYNIL